MTECDNCGDDVLHVWRHRAFGETEAHRENRWVCAGCHPDLPGTIKNEATEGGKTVVTDGGRFRCPNCAGETVNGQGLFSCLDCTWAGPC